MSAVIETTAARQRLTRFTPMSNTRANLEPPAAESVPRTYIHSVRHQVAQSISLKSHGYNQTHVERATSSGSFLPSSTRSS
ncbi:hypothetical protein B0H10DRAFT_2058759 [Mycena sp. CBHHK59/15]|nr:hypothetical protein B0H10DRAFT_2058759 [Mycena sp. CBHHK59/15]